ncbi:ABC transporter permease [Arthrobacter sp. AQ5-05]|uniref:energy-coupling factor transporter transmembrane component T family protein n=1 Tax=Arthrobacter sp. AQ5-05 TaxID=2184581 RepID=UPI000DCBD747|nr:energy-coupling factor transporter transmembrane component T [Arthrobacter sp. AQ5-05]RAX51056.1 ABC transporter permease [Arthrobacter sp. AQ5-05]
MPRTCQLHPFTVLALAAAVTATTTAAGRWWLSVAVLLACLLLAAWARRARRLAGLAAAILAPAWGSQLLIHGMADTAGGHVLAAAGPLRITAEGLATAGALGLRTGVLVAAGLLCTLLIDRHELIAAVDLSPAPPQLGYLLAATLFLLPALERRQRAIGQAQSLRGATPGGGPRGWFRRVRLRSVPLVLGALQDAADRSAHLAARGFPAAGPHTRLREVQDSAAQRRVRRIALACTVLGPVAVLAPSWMGAA